MSVDWLAVAPAQWEHWAREHGTPYYLLDADAVAKRIVAVRQAFAGRVQVYFAVKANPNLGLLRALVGQADGVDISSGGELQQALKAGFAAQAMSFAGPAKTEEELAAAIHAGVGAISVESARELRECARLARSIGRPANVLLRVNPLLANKTFGLKMGGGRAVQFGFDEEALPEACALWHEAREWLALQGVHCYVGSQGFEVEGVAEALRNGLRIGGEVAARCGVPLKKVNLGGGFGVAAAQGGKALDLAALGTTMQPHFERFASEHPHCQPLVELGRFLASEAGIYVVRVIDCKASRGKRFALCDGGLNHQLAAAGTFGAALRGNFPMLNLSRPGAAVQPWHVAGPSCNPTDLLGVDTALAEPRPGDLLGVTHSGSYGLSASPMLFLGHDTPVELVRHQGQVSVGRQRHSLADFN